MKQWQQCKRKWMDEKTCKLVCVKIYNFWFVKDIAILLKRQARLGQGLETICWGLNFETFKNVLKFNENKIKQSTQLKMFEMKSPFIEIHENTQRANRNIKMLYIIYHWVNCKL